MLRLLILFNFILATNISAEEFYWMKIPVSTQEERSRLADTGVTIEKVEKNYVTATGINSEYLEVKSKFSVATSFVLNSARLEFPKSDERFHDYKEMTTALKKIAADYPDIVALDSIGKSLDGMEIHHVRISTDLDKSHEKPGIVFMGGHHAREHLSTETPFKFIKYLAEEYSNGNTRIQNLLSSREIHIIPIVNPDGKEFDIKGGRYKYWRKNRRLNRDNTFGVDLNRNYSFKWGQGGASPNPRSQTYRGPNAFSEPETQAIKKFIESNTNISILLSFHTFSELILYPWGYTDSKISEQRDYLVHKKMAETMAAMNNYKPQQSSDLYITSGDTTDWSYGEHGIISFTFELDPKDMFSGGFYPGQSYIDSVFKKNIEPCLYLAELADNPYRVIQTDSQALGLNSPLF